MIVKLSYLDFSEVRDPVPLRHFGKRELMAKIDLMEDRFDAPMLFDASLGPTNAIHAKPG